MAFYTFSWTEKENGKPDGKSNLAKLSEVELKKKKIYKVWGEIKHK